MARVEATGGADLQGLDLLTGAATSLVKVPCHPDSQRECERPDHHVGYVAGLQLEGESGQTGGGAMAFLDDRTQGCDARSQTR